MTDEEEGHEKDATESEEDYLDRQFSRDNFWGPFIALVMMKPLELVIINGTPGGWVLDVLTFMVLTPLALYAGLKWPQWEHKYAKYLPWMDSETSE